MSDALHQVNTLVRQESHFVESVIQEVGRVIVGQRYTVERLLVGVLVGGHILLEGVPGLAKTLTVKTLADCASVSFRRIQFTPDLLPSDLIGTLVFNQATHEFSPKFGPVFANFVLADEINRAPAKVQSALLEAMQEKQVTLGETTYKLAEPFLVLATQNPIDQEGTYSLPEAQIDRFLMKLKVGYPSKSEERDIINRASGLDNVVPSHVISGEDILRARHVVKQVYVDEKIKDYVLDIVHATRQPGKAGLPELEQLIQFGASPRASIALIQAGKAHAFIRGRGYVTPEDIKSIVFDVLRHRVIPSFEAEAEELDSDKIIEKVLSHIDVP